MMQYNIFSLRFFILYLLVFLYFDLRLQENYNLKKKRFQLSICGSVNPKDELDAGS